MFTTNINRLDSIAHYRAWDDVAKKMYGASAPEQYDDSLLLRFKHFETEKPIYMRSFGMQDKNGKVMFEGDTVIWRRIHYTDCSCKKVGYIDDPVVGSLYFVNGLIPCIHYADGYGGVFDPVFHLLDREADFEVVGDIYRNPDLVKELQAKFAAEAAETDGSEDDNE